MIGREDLICASDAEAIELATKFSLARRPLRD